MAFVTIKDKDNATLGHLQTDANERLGVHNLLHVQDRKATGTHAGTFTSGAWRTRQFNTELVNNIVGASLTDNQITLPSGVYICDGSASAQAIDQHKVRLYNITGLEVIDEGVSNFSQSGSNIGARAQITTKFTLTETSVIELQHLCRTTRADYGFGSGYNYGQDTEIFSDLRIWRIGDVEES